MRLFSKGGGGAAKLYGKHDSVLNYLIATVLQISPPTILWVQPQSQQSGSDDKDEEWRISPERRVCDRPE